MNKQRAYAVGLGTAIGIMAIQKLSGDLTVFGYIVLYAITFAIILAMNFLVIHWPDSKPDEEKNDFVEE